MMDINVELHQWFISLLIKSPRVQLLKAKLFRASVFQTIKRRITQARKFDQKKFNYFLNTISGVLI